MATVKVTIDPDGDLTLKLPKYDCCAHHKGLYPKNYYSVRTDVLVSSKHMSVSSPVFKAMLQHGFREGITLATTGKCEISLIDSDDHPLAMNILLHIIHGRFHSVPYRIELGVWKDIAILVDKYQMHEVTKGMCEIWKKGLEIFDHHNTLAMGLCIAWVFQMDDVFLEVTKFIQRYPKGLTRILEDSDLTHLPIPQYVIDKIDEKSGEALAEAIGELESLIERYQCHPVNCGRFARYPNNQDPQSLAFGNIHAHRKNCDAMVLGSLIRSATENNLYPLPRLASDERWDFDSFWKATCKLEVTTACYMITKREVDKHCILEDFHSKMRAISRKSRGVKLSEVRKH